MKMSIFKVETMKTTTRVFSVLVRKYSIVAPERIIKSPAPSLIVPEGNFVNAIFKDANKHWMKPAIECSESGLVFTYSELLDQINKWSGFLMSLGLTSQDSISIITSNCLQFVPIFFGTISLGIPVSPLNPLYTPNEIRRLIQITRSKLIIYSREVEENLSLALKEDISKFHLFCIGKPLNLKAQNVEDVIYGKQSVPYSQPPELTGKEIMYIPFSSGTTGPPKAVELTHNASLHWIYSYINPYFNITWKPEGLDQTTVMLIQPIFHVTGIFLHLSFGLFTGSKVVIFPKYSPDILIDGITKHKITYIFAPPSILNFLIKSSKCTEDSLKSLNTLITGAAPVQRSTIDDFRRKFKLHIDILEVYGMTEVLMATLMPRNFSNLLGCGRLLSNVEAKIICTMSGKALGPNQRGEIYIKTPSAMKGYLNNEKARDEIMKNGWFQTGDIGYYDESEYFYVTDRIKDLIKVHNMQVSPSEIESELQKHPLVKECCVLGKPDSEYGEVPFAFVVPKEEVSEAELQNFLKDKLANYKQLKGGIKFIDSFPKTEIGKVMKTELLTKM